MSKVTEANDKDSVSSPRQRILFFLFIGTLLSFAIAFVVGLIWSIRAEASDPTLESLNKMGVMFLPFFLAAISIILSFVFRKKDLLLKLGKNLISGSLAAFLSLALALAGFVPQANHDYSYVSAIAEETGLALPKNGRVKRETVSGGNEFSIALVYFTNPEEAEAFTASVLSSSSWVPYSEAMHPFTLRINFQMDQKNYTTDRYFLFNRAEKTVNKAPSVSGIFSYFEIQHLEGTPYLGISEYRIPYSPK